MADENTLIDNQENRALDVPWLACGVAITFVAAFLRFFWITLKPLHHDEGVNGYFLTNLVRDGVYKYDPANYHGPTLYYIAYPFVKLFGLETVPIRISVGIFGVLTVVLALYLKRYIGRLGSLLAALFIALSPGMVYISRYFIHEIFFVFIGLAIVVSLLFFIEQRKPGPGAIFWLALLLLVCFLPSALNLASFLGGTNDFALWALRIGFFLIESFLVFFVVRMILSWREGRVVYAMLASASAALMFATKETAFITLGTMGIACFAIWVWRPIRESEAFRNAWPIGIGAIHLVLVCLAIYFRSTLADAWAWLNEALVGQNKIQEPYVFYSVIFLSIVGLITWVLFVLHTTANREAKLEDENALTFSRFREALGDQSSMLLIAGVIALVFVYVSVLFFSSFFTYAEGIGKAFEAYTIWTKTGSKDHTQNGWPAYLKWGMKIEGPILILSTIGILVAIIKANRRFAMFTALWAFGLFAAYSIIPYKTPWLALSFLLPMCIIAGYGIAELLKSGSFPLKIAAAILAIGGTAQLAYQAYDLNFIRYDDEEMGYVYAHTKRGFLTLVNDIERYAEKSGKGKDATIEIVSPDYWPMTWYLNNYSHANFHGQLIDANTSEIIIAKKDDQDAAMVQKYSAHYKWVDVYPLRPGVNLVLLVRRDLADSNTKELYKLSEYVRIPGYTD